MTAVVVFLVFSRRKISDWLEKAVVVVPVNPFKRREFDILQAAPGPAPADDFRLE